MSVTQNRLATGKKVNSALDNPTNFFTSQSLSNRASDLNSLLDSIGQAQKTLEAADHGITSLTKLVQSAKSIAKQARQAAQPTAISYGAISVNDTTQTETLGSFTGSGFGATTAGNITFDVKVNGTTYSLTAAVRRCRRRHRGSRLDQCRHRRQRQHRRPCGCLGLRRPDQDRRQRRQHRHHDYRQRPLGGSRPHRRRRDQPQHQLHQPARSHHRGRRHGGSSTLTVAVNGGSNQVITFGNGGGQVHDLAGLNTALGGLTGVTAGVTGNALSFAVASSATANSLTLIGSTGVTTALGVTNATSNGVASVSTPDATRTSLQSDFNNILTQIDALAADSSYNGINLLYGDDLKVVFNENGTSTLTITGVTYNSAGLGLSPRHRQRLPGRTQISTHPSQRSTPR